MKYYLVERMGVKDIHIFYIKNTKKARTIYKKWGFFPFLRLSINDYKKIEDLDAEYYFSLHKVKYLSGLNHSLKIKILK